VIDSALDVGFAGLPVEAFTNWADAVDALLTVGDRLGRPVPVVLDEFPYLVEQAPELPSSRRPIYQVTEPLLRLHHLIIRPFEARLVGRGRAQVWAQSADTVASLINGPHLEELARSWCVDHASTETLGGLPSRCEPALVACREHKPNHELDVVVTADTLQTGARILAIGEVKATRSPVGLNQLLRLEHIRTLLPPAMSPVLPRLLLFARHGFTLELTAAATARNDLELIDLNRLYAGS
jgi:hypothetical protein